MDSSKILKLDKVSLFIPNNKNPEKKFLDIDITRKNPTICKRFHTYQTEIREKTITPDLISAIYSDTTQLQLKGIKILRKLLCREKDPPIDEIINFGIIPRLVTFLSSPNEMLQFEAAWALTNISSGTSIQTRYVIEAGAVPAFIKLLSSNSVRIEEQALWGIGNIAGDCPDFREYVLECGVVSPLKTLIINTTKLFTLQIAAWMLTNLCRGKSTFCKTENFISIFEHLIRQGDSITLSDTFWALSYLSEGGRDRIQCIIDTNLLPLIVERLVLDDSVVHPALHVIGNICAGNDKQIQAILDCKILDQLQTHITSTNESIRRLSCWIISNIVGNSVNQIQAVIDSNIIPALFQVFTSGSAQSKKEAMWVVKNISTRGTPEHIIYLIERNVIDHLCNLLSSTDPEIIRIALIALESLLQMAEQDARIKGKYNYVAVKIEECNGLDKLEYLLSHGNVDIYRKAYDIIETYFGCFESTQS